ncbi:MULTISPECIES: hypothetical protein [unclassified Streptomyces]|uniref:hypothetical protein n=1 Tax=unclassified Streptomyces TaxID=2593676 RepID=UPI002E821C70|nr:hypothetical protein [Streptomyces sp. NBC_00589]WTI35916.1 hypothetical protein OIC96_13360 [Streptomyces sp. NBC_00775]WUB30410.1 hypothetical protein OHA51_36370 [Streptomyces sp. NBC_00589]
MDGAAILFILAIAGVASICLFALKGLLDQVPDVIDSAGKARDAWHRFKKPEVSPRTDDEEPPAAA